ncbi:methyltransferase domain-containing protein [Pseudodesulfovibrio portus]|uniref:Hydroxyindole O-methyltransferase n=1 Tax=Pseudodesulfovibrio portus TaxID=231439 RepID=A0ABM8APH4_9BACT|nr:methyltransferase domain-containing protein [Pseudodesulfovibrio portus]BDQ33294.1 hydroxyindole O-methyltransferase [Pseudodesulfovibrio portus]
MQTPKSDFSFVETMLMQGVGFSAIMDSARMGLFDSLEQGPLTAAAVAGKLGLEEEPTEALLELLAGMQLVVSGPTGYANSLVAGEHLVSTSPFYQGKALELQSRFNDFVTLNLGRLLRGESDMREEVDDGWGSEDSMTGTLQHARLGGLQDTLALVRTLPDLNESGMLCDIGGNHGELSMSLLENYPGMTGELLDLPHVAEAVGGRIEKRELGGRLKPVGMDLRLERLGADRYDLALASHVLYGFVDDLEGVARMLYESLKPGGWFVSHHLNVAGDLDPNYTAVVQFITRVSGYKSHFIGKDHLEGALLKAGFTDILSCPAGKRRKGLLMAGRKA